MTVRIDGLDELHRVAVDFGRAAADVLPEVDKVVKKGAQNVKDDMVAETVGSWFSAVGTSISYDRAYGLGSVGYEVGPDKGRAGGALGVIAYFGGANGGGGTLDIDAPLRREEPRLTKALGDVMEGLL